MRAVDDSHRPENHLLTPGKWRKKGDVSHNGSICKTSHISLVSCQCEGKNPSLLSCTACAPQMRAGWILHFFKSLFSLPQELNLSMGRIYSHNSEKQHSSYFWGVCNPIQIPMPQMMDMTRNSHHVPFDNETPLSEGSNDWLWVRTGIHALTPLEMVPLICLSVWEVFIISLAGVLATL